MISNAALFPHDATLLIDPTRRVGFKGLLVLLRPKLSAPIRMHNAPGNVAAHANSVDQTHLT